MNMHLKEIGGLANPRRWSGFAWTVVLFVLVLSIGTAVVGVKLYEVTDREVLYNTH
jgi:UPF0716 family protein affecting phage T7 exclusion